MSKNNSTTPTIIIAAIRVHIANVSNGYPLRVVGHRRQDYFFDRHRKTGRNERLYVGAEKDDQAKTFPLADAAAEMADMQRGQLGGWQLVWEFITAEEWQKQVDAEQAEREAQEEEQRLRMAQIEANRQLAAAAQAEITRLEQPGAVAEKPEAAREPARKGAKPKGLDDLEKKLGNPGSTEGK